MTIGFEGREVDISARHDCSVPNEQFHWLRVTYLQTSAFADLLHSHCPTLKVQESQNSKNRLSGQLANRSHSHFVVVGYVECQHCAAR